MLLIDTAPCSKSTFQVPLHLKCIMHMIYTMINIHESFYTFFKLGNWFLNDGVQWQVAQIRFGNWYLSNNNQHVLYCIKILEIQNVSKYEW